jgi:formylglycine-generating enzyme required for sulfatase activity
MGSATNSWGHHRNEAPPRRVRITKPFYMGIHEVTVAQYESVMGVAHEGQKKGEGVGNVAPGPTNQPVDRVSWSDATDFCRKLGEKTGRSIRLPTEAEWEYACRAGSPTLWSFGDDVNELNQYAWYNAEGKSGLQNVGGRKPNAWGLYDMHGNVREWCRDRFCADYYAWGPTDNPPGPGTGIFRVLRGGSAGNLLAGRNAEFARSARRAYGRPDIRHMEVGFRVAVEIADGQ